MNLSFKQYIESKERLRESILKDPIVKINYAFKKYCKFPTGIKEEKQFVSLKPNDVVTVAWKYTSPDHRLIESIEFNNEDEIVFTYWKDDKIANWIKTNCVEL